MSEKRQEPASESRRSKPGGAWSRPGMMVETAVASGSLLCRPPGLPARCQVTPRVRTH
jgi:hypothetical protein